MEHPIDTGGTLQSTRKRVPRPLSSRLKTPFQQECPVRIAFPLLSYCGRTKSCATWKLWETTVGWLLTKESNHSRIFRWCDMDFFHPQYQRKAFQTTKSRWEVSNLHHKLQPFRREQQVRRRLLHRLQLCLQIAPRGCCARPAMERRGGEKERKRGVGFLRLFEVLVQLTMARHFLGVDFLEE